MSRDSKAYAAGFQEGWLACEEYHARVVKSNWAPIDKIEEGYHARFKRYADVRPYQPKPRKKSDWQRYMANPRHQIKYKSGKRKGRLNLKAMGVAYRRQKR